MTTHPPASDSERVAEGAPGPGPNSPNSSDGASDDRRALLRAALDAPDPYPADRFSGRGIVICAGGARLLTGAWVTINVLRRTLGCTLPIQVWHLGTAELGPFERTLFEDLGVEVVDAAEVRRTHPVRLLGGWELKPYALAHCRFAEVLLLDADNVPAADPTPLFDAWQLDEGGGAAFWPDVERLTEASPIWDLVGLPYRPVTSFETGQVLLRKADVWHPLMVTLHLNAHSDLYYRYLNGDKDTFLFAWLLTGRRWAMPGTPPQVLSHTVYQHDFEGRVTFQHRTGAKWVLRGDNRAEPGFALEAECLAYVRELRALWSGRMVRIPERSPAAQDAERVLATTRWFSYERLGADTRLLELRNGHRVGRGFSPHERAWYVEDGTDAGPDEPDGPAGADPGGPAGPPAALRLVLLGDDSVTCRLTPGDDGTWRGTWEHTPGFEVELTPVHEEAGVAGVNGSAVGTGGAVDIATGNVPGASGPVPGAPMEAPTPVGLDTDQVRGLLAHLSAGGRTGAERDAMVTTLATLAGAFPGLTARLRHELTGWEARGDELVCDAIGAAIDEADRQDARAGNPSLHGRRNPGARPEGPRPEWRYEPLPSPPASTEPRVLVLTPVKDAEEHLDRYVELLGRLDFPPDRLSLGILEGDSTDGTWAALNARLGELRRRYRRVTLLRRDFGFRLPPGVPRWNHAFQLARRTVLARARNHLLVGALGDEDWVLWLDVDVCDYPPTVLRDLLAAGRDIVQPHCVVAYGGPTFDWNAWREHGQVRMDQLRGGPDLVRLDAVGGTMLLVRADAHRNGLVFPPMLYGGGSRWARDPHPVFRAPGEVETEGLGIMAKDMGYECWGMPNLEIVHADR